MGKTELNIVRTTRGFACLFEHKGQEYIGSLIWQDAYETAFIECIIFKAVDHKITFANALGVCCARDCDFSQDALRERIEDFIACN